MDQLKTRTVLLFPLLACCLTALAASNVQARLSPKQARTAITRMAGFELNSGSVRVKTISETNAAAAEVSAEIKTVFKLAQDKQGRWRVAEIRTGHDRWEQIDLIANALRTQIGTGGCTAPDPPAKGSLATDPSVKRTRCLLGRLLGVDSPSDAVRIQIVEPMAVPLASQASATVVAWVKVDARLVNDKTGWRVSELRTGSRDWAKLEPLVAAVNGEKQRIAREEMELIARALEKFRRERGFYVVSDSQAVAIDHLSPRYLAQVIRVDPWNQPYKYQGERDHFTLRSAGPDGKPDTSDDIQLASPSR
jgi:type II secretion system (T2SS) protein G